MRVVPGGGAEFFDAVEGLLLAGFRGEFDDPAVEQFVLGDHRLGKPLEHGERLALDRALFVEQAEAGILGGDGCGAGLQLAEIGAAGGDVVGGDVFPGDEAVEQELE